MIIQRSNCGLSVCKQATGPTIRRISANEYSPWTVIVFWTTLATTTTRVDLVHCTYSVDLHEKYSFELKDFLSHFVLIPDSCVEPCGLVRSKAPTDTRTCSLAGVMRDVDVVVIVNLLPPLLIALAFAGHLRRNFLQRKRTAFI